MLLIDTVYVSAVLNTRDQWHAAALRWQQHMATERPRYITTEFVLWEIANGLAAVRFRRQAIQAISTLRANPRVEIVTASGRLFDAAVDFYQKRPDKEWGLTDCASFVVMAERGLTDALTADEHFRQAGVRPLLLEDPPSGA